jgi:hypothetical protein
LQVSLCGGCNRRRTPKNRDRKLNFLTNPLPVWEGTKGRGSLNGYCSPSPFPSPVKGEGTIGTFLCLFFRRTADYCHNNHW